MRVAKEAVGYYCKVTGKEWCEFYNNLDAALAAEEGMPISDELWLIKKLMNVITKSGMTVNEFRINKDAIKGVFDEAARKQAGEFFTPEIWCAEGRKYFDKHIPNWHEMNVWDGSCYSMDTEILTKRGWVTYDELLDSDEIYTLNPSTLMGEWSGFHSRFKKPYNGKMIGIKNNVFDVLTTEEHRQFVKAPEEGTSKFIGSSSLIDDDKYIYTMYFPAFDVANCRHETPYKVCGAFFTKNDVYEQSYAGFVWDLTTSNDNHVFCVRRNGKPYFSSNCGSGNLMRTAGHPTDKLFLSSLQEDDITLIKNTSEYAGATAFQLDFLEELDYDEVNTAFLDKLPERLQQIIRNDEGLIFYMNPPYKSGCAKATDVGRHMIDIGLGAAAYDIYYQFMWRVMHLVELFRLKNVWFGCFGPLTFFTGSGANVLLKEFEKCFEFVDGMCLSAQEFSDTSDSIAWGIGCTLWKARGGYIADAQHKDILLDKKYKLPNGSIECCGKVLYEPPREKLSKWVLPKDVLFYEDAPSMTSHLTFRGGEALEKKAYSSGKIATNALGTLMIGNTLTRSADQSAILSMPTSIQFTSITEENFWRCVASYTFRRVIDANWAIAKKEISAPNEKAEGYQEWLRNALVMFLFEWKSMMSSIRDVEYGGGMYTVRNKLFYLTADEVRENCSDERILKDLEDNPPCNEFILNVIKECEPYWHEDVRQLYDWCKAYTLFSYDHRREVDYKGSLDAWDAGFQQIRTGLWSEELQKEAERRMAIARDFLRKDIMKFGFVNEIEEE